jgi:hypothetical protein
VYPNGEPEGCFNLWTGLAVKPVKGSYARIEKHLREIICAGDTASYIWLQNWIARIFQRPGEPGQVAVVLRGGQGVGKSIVARWIKTICGPVHSLSVTNPKHLIGNFNAHLREVIFLNPEEAFYAGSREAESILKTLITEPTMVVESKGRNSIPAPNYLHILMTSNESWVAPVAADDRRWAIFDVLDTFARKPDYFRLLMEEAANGGLAAWLYDLMELDLRSFDVFDHPKTGALGQEKLRSLRGVDQWVYDVLSEGVLRGRKAEGFTYDVTGESSNRLDPLNFGEYAPADWEVGKVKVDKGDLYRTYCAGATARKEYRAEALPQWRARLSKLLGNAVGDHRPKNNGPRLLQFAPLAECRKAFEEHLGLEQIHWDLDQTRLHLDLNEKEQAMTRIGGHV